MEVLEICESEMPQLTFGHSFWRQWIIVNEVVKVPVNLVSCMWKRMQFLHLLNLLTVTTFTIGFGAAGSRGTRVRALDFLLPLSAHLPKNL